MKFVSVCAAQILAVTVVAATTAAASEPPLPKRVADAARDSSAAPDITEVRIGNDVVAGALVVWVVTPNRPAFATGDAVVLSFDTDRDRSTGGVEHGAEYEIRATDRFARLYRWDQYEFVQEATPSLTARYLPEQRALRISVHPSALGGAHSFELRAVAANGEARDLAPDASAAAIPYVLQSAQVGLKIVRSETNPSQPYHGWQFAASLTIRRTDTGEALETGRVTCVLTVGGRRVRVLRSTFTGGAAYCVWELPWATRGKSGRGTMRVSYGGSTVQKTFAVRVR